MKILSLDGGGSWALIQARCLMDLYGDIKGNELLKNFDLVISNSGGSLVLACLIENMSLSETVGLFMDENARKDIFSKLTMWEKSPLLDIARLDHIGPKYSAARKLTGLHKHLPQNGDKYLSDIPTLIGKPKLQIIVCAFAYERNREVFFRSNKESLADSYYYDQVTNNNTTGKFVDVTVAEAVHGSSNAPLNYFDKPALINYKGENFNHQFWDGAIGGYNNPVFAGVLEAIVNKVPANEIEVLSLGTASNLLPLFNAQHPAPTKDVFMYQKGDSSFSNDINKMATSIVADPPDSASFHAYAFLHPDLPKTSTRFFRFSPVVKPVCNNNTWNVPSSFSESDFNAIVELDMDAVEQPDVMLISKLCDAWMNPNGEIENQAVRTNNQLECIIGYPTYTDCKNAFAKYFMAQEAVAPV